MTNRFNAYYQLTKPGIIYGNALVAAAGFAYASHGSFNWVLFLSLLSGLSLVIASACVCNNYYDRVIDAHMTRTQKRALVSGDIHPTHALYFGTMLGLVGIGLLFFFTTPMALYVGISGWVIYVALYTPLKHKSGHALWVGALAGATPPVAGYAAVTNTIDIHAVWLFIFLFLWQIPHFIGIAMYRFDEYHNAGVPLILKKSPSAKNKRRGRIIFYLSLVVLLLWCGVLTFHK